MSLVLCCSGSDPGVWYYVFVFGGRAGASLLISLSCVVNGLLVLAFASSCIRISMLVIVWSGFWLDVALVICLAWPNIHPCISVLTERSGIIQ